MEKFITKSSEIIKGRTASGEDKNQYCVLAQEDLDGRLTAAVITPSISDGYGSLRSAPVSEVIGRNVPSVTIVPPFAFRPRSTALL